LDRSQPFFRAANGNANGKILDSHRNFIHAFFFCIVGILKTENFSLLAFAEGKAERAWECADIRLTWLKKNGSSPL
jgi:hypothetical protein